MPSFCTSTGIFAHGLHRVHMEEHVVLLCDLADLLDRLDHADFVVGVHDGDEDRFRRDRPREIVEIDQAFACPQAGR